MTRSKTRKFGAISVRPQVKDGLQTGRWFADVPPALNSGRRQRLLFDNVNMAEEFASHVLARTLTPTQAAFHRLAIPASGMTTKRPNGTISTNDISNWNFRQLSDVWLRHTRQEVAAGNKRQRSQDTDEFRLRPILKHFSLWPIQQINDLAWTEYKTRRMFHHGASAGTAQGETSVIRKILFFAERNFPSSFRAPRITGVAVEVNDDERLTQDQAARLVQAVPERWRNLVWLLSETGLRRSEALNLTWAQIDIDRATVEVRRLKKRRFKGKTAFSLRTVEFSRALAERFAAMRAALADSPEKITNDAIVFQGNKAGQPPVNLKRVFAQAAKAAGLTRDGAPIVISPQVLRRAYISWLSNRPDLASIVVQSVAGHAPGSDVTRRHYARAMADERHRALVELPVERAPAGPEGVAKNLAIAGNDENRAAREGE